MSSLRPHSACRPIPRLIRFVRRFAGSRFGYRLWAAVDAGAEHLQQWWGPQGLDHAGL